MIIIFGHKTFKKFWEDKSNRKHFLGHHGGTPLIIDGTDGESSLLNSIGNVFSLQGMSAGGKLLNGGKKADPLLEKTINRADVKKAQKKFFGSTDFRNGIVSITKMFLESKGDMNIALVITEDAYSSLADVYIRKIVKLLDLKKKGKEAEGVFDKPVLFDTLDDVCDVTKKADVFFTYKEVKHNGDLLRRNPTKKELKALAKGVATAMGDKDA